MFDVSHICKMTEVKAPSLNDIPIEMPHLAQKKADEMINFWDGLRGEKFSVESGKSKNNSECIPPSMGKGATIALGVGEIVVDACEVALDVIPAVIPAMPLGGAIGVAAGKVAVEAGKVSMNVIPKIVDRVAEINEQNKSTTE